MDDKDTRATRVESDARGEAERRLAALEERFRVLVASIADTHAAVELAPDGMIRGFGAGAQRVFGWSESDALGAHVRLLFTPEDREAGVPEAELEQARRDGAASADRFLAKK